jgi:hypothetical protein
MHSISSEEICGIGQGYFGQGFGIVSLEPGAITFDAEAAGLP